MCTASEIVLRIINIILTPLKIVHQCAYYPTSRGAMSIRPRCVLERTKHPLDDVSLDRCVPYDPDLPGGGGDRSYFLG
jgi:hypothetical protein